MDLIAHAVVSGRYRVVRKVGSGSFGEVWEGEDLETGERVALKTLRTEAQVDDVVVRFRREAYFLARVRSDHVARVIDFVPDDGGLLVMQFIDGVPLSNVLQQRALSVEEAIALGADVLTGVRDLHAARIIHRDLKPGNVMLQPLGDGRVRAVIVDFGLGRLSNSAPSGQENTNSLTPSMTELTRANMVLGTLPYMSPEQILNSHQATQQSDLYSIGAILYRAVAGVHAFGQEDAPHALVTAKLIQNAPKLRTGRDDPMARGLEEVVDKALMRLPSARYKDASEMLDALARLRPSAGREDTDSHPTLKVTVATDGSLPGENRAGRGTEASPATASASGVATSVAPGPAHAIAPASAKPRSPLYFVAVGLVVFAGGMGAGIFVARRLAQARPDAAPAAVASERATTAFVPTQSATSSGAPAAPVIALELDTPVSSEPAAAADAGASVASASAATSSSTASTARATTIGSRPAPVRSAISTASAASSSPPLPVRIDSPPTGGVQGVSTDFPPDETP